MGKNKVYVNLDEWLLHNPQYSQEERETIVEAIEEYNNYKQKRKQLAKLKTYEVKIEYPKLSFEINAANKKEAEEYAWFEFDQTQPHEPQISIKQQKSCRERKLAKVKFRRVLRGAM